MEFFTTAVSSLSTVVTAIGAGVGVWGVINLMEGYGGDNPASKSQGQATDGRRRGHSPGPEGGSPAVRSARLMYG